jgi:hypothetical protein
MGEDYRTKMPKWMPVVGLLLYIAIGLAVVGGILEGVWLLVR